MAKKPAIYTSNIKLSIVRWVRRGSRRRVPNTNTTCGQIKPVAAVLLYESLLKTRT